VWTSQKKELKHSKSKCYKHKNERKTEKKRIILIKKTCWWITKKRVGKMTNKKILNSAVCTKAVSYWLRCEL
jgi:hypothetical protein